MKVEDSPKLVRVNSPSLITLLSFELAILYTVVSSEHVKNGADNGIRTVIEVYYRQGNNGHVELKGKKLLP